VLREDGADGRMSFSYRPELAKAIAAALLGPVPPAHGRVFDIVTPPPLSLAELAEIAARVTGKPYRYEPAPDAAWDARWRAIGRTGWQLESGHTTYHAIRSGEFDVVSDDFRSLTGIAPLSIGDVIARHADELPL
jgi:NAD(P)H dehydrogenase (quinone)